MKFQSTSNPFISKREYIHNGVCCKPHGRGEGPLAPTQDANQRRSRLSRKDFFRIGVFFLLFTLFQFSLAQTYKVDAQLISKDDMPMLSVSVTTLENAEPVTTSKVFLRGPASTLELLAMQPGMHLMIPGLGESMTFVAGESYTLEVDPEGDGTANATTSLVMPGMPTLSIEDGATLPGDFSLSWQDPAAGTANYDPVYMVSVDDGNSGFGVTCAFITKETNFTVSAEHCSDAGSQGLDVLPSKTYGVSVTAFAGSDPRTSEQQPNITGDNVTGLFVIMQASEINITVK
jgi:hypothetical protein